VDRRGHWKRRDHRHAAARSVPGDNFLGQQTDGLSVRLEKPLHEDLSREIVEVILLDRLERSHRNARNTRHLGKPHALLLAALP